MRAEMQENENWRKSKNRNQDTMQNNAESKTCTCSLVDLGLESQRGEITKRIQRSGLALCCRAVCGVGPTTRDRRPFLGEAQAWTRRIQVDCRQLALSHAYAQAGLQRRLMVYALSCAVWSTKYAYRGTPPEQERMKSGSFKDKDISYSLGSIYAWVVLVPVFILGSRMNTGYRHRPSHLVHCHLDWYGCPIIWGWLEINVQWCLPSSSILYRVFNTPLSHSSSKKKKKSWLQNSIHGGICILLSTLAPWH